MNRARYALAALLAVAMPQGFAATWIAGPEIIHGRGGEEIRGVVFEDLNGDGRRQRGEDGIAGVLVSNGLDVVRTDASGGYRLAVRADMDLFVIQPSGWQVPVDERNVPQFAYIHKPAGSPGTLRYGGLEPTGPAPEAVNFPLRRVEDDGSAFTCAVVGDSQPYNNVEVSHFRDSAVADLVVAGLGSGDCMLYLGDVVGDDLGLLERLFELGSVVGVPQWAVPGNHDVDFDVADDADSLDTWRRTWGPPNYAFEQGDALFIGMDNIYVNPCTSQDPDVARPAVQARCERGFGYTTLFTRDQLAWLENLLREVPQDKLVVFAHHAPLLNFRGSSELSHTWNAARVHQLLEGRPALSLSGHTHTLENMDPGEYYEAFDAVGVGPLPFRHIVAGAASGRWWGGDFNVDGDPQSLTVSGEPKGLLMLEIDGAQYRERFVGSRLGNRGQWVDFNTPAYRSWYAALDAWLGKPAGSRDPVPPVTTNDLADTRVLTPRDLEQGVYLTVNFWQGSASAQVEAAIDAGEPFALTRTQEGRGEAVRHGVDYADPFSVRRQATIGRFAYQSRAGGNLTQGHVRGKGNVRGDVRPPQAYGGKLPDSNQHLWRARMPRDLAEGVHTLTVVSTDRNGQQWKDIVTFEVRPQPLPEHFPRELWQDRE